MSAPGKHPLSQVLSLTVFVAALGYFVDMFDLLLFPIVRQPSLTDLGIPQGDAQVSATFLLLNSQMVGMLLGGIFWGVLGDKKGRLSTLFGSIALYSVANIANAFVHGLPSYAVWRFLAGDLGLMAGYWAVFVTIAAEQFGTNLRATVATTVPNFVRGSVPLIAGGFSLLRGPLGYVGSAWKVGLVCISLALVSLLGMSVTAVCDLDFLE